MRLPDLPRRRASEKAHWTLRFGNGVRPERRRLAAEHLVDGRWLRVWETTGGSLFAYDPVGEFEISADGREIAWHPAESTLPEHVRAVVLGPVLALALHAQGTPVLHGSAVRIGREGVAFIAPKGYGKSTLTAAMVEAGAQLITDDTLAVDLSGEPMLLPGVHSVKLWRDAFAKVAPRLPREMSDGVKPTLRRFPSHVRRNRSTPFAAVYLLTPVAAAPDAKVERQRLPLRNAALALVANSKLGSLLEPRGSGLLLGAATDIAARVPVYALRVPRAWDQLGEVVASINRWHGAEARDGAGT